MWPSINAQTSWHKPGTLAFLTLPQEEPALGKGKIKPRGENSGKSVVWVFFFFFPYHINNLELPIGEDNGIGRSCHGQHEGQGRSQCAGQHHIERVDANCFSLDTKKKSRDDGLDTQKCTEILLEEIWLYLSVSEASLFPKHCSHSYFGAALDTSSIFMQQM